MPSSSHYANHITTTLRRKKTLAAINPDKVQLAEQAKHRGRFERLEDPTTTHQGFHGRQGHRPLRYEADAPVTTLRQLAPRFESHRSRCTFSKLGRFEGLRLSPFQSNTTNSDQSSSGQNYHCPGCPGVTRADLVAFTTSTGHQSASSPTLNTRNTEEPNRFNNNASNVPKTTSSRLACFQRSR